MPDLSGVTVVVTRPAHQADKLCQLIEAAGGNTLRFPVIEIGPPEDPQKCQQQLAQLANFELAIFISANAVTAAMNLLQSPHNWPTSTRIAAVGKATAQALAKHQLTVTYVAPEPYNSEALLSLPELQQLTGKRICIFRGNGGREYLQQKLRERGAEVAYIECYQRQKTEPDTTLLYTAWEQGQRPPIVVTSNEGLKNLQSIIDNQHQTALLSSPLIVISERTAALARQQGFEQTPVVAQSANDDAIVAAIVAHA